MKRTLYVGDVHAKPSDLDECRRLTDLIVGVVTSKNVDRVVFLGDQLHTHLTVNLEALGYWYETLRAILAASSTVEVVLVVGNHDKRVGEDLTEIHSMLPFTEYSQRVNVIDVPVEMDGILFLPYYATNEEFVAACKASAAKTVVCHQTFDGSRFENGMYAPDGIDPNDIPQEQVISGHLHAGQEFGKVWYVGSPRWMTLSDANQEKAIWVVEHDAHGKVVSREGIDTSVVCTKIVALVDLPDKPAVVPEGENLSIVVDVHGPKDYISRRTEELAEAGVARMRTFPTRTAAAEVSESEGVPIAFAKYLDKFEPPNGTDLTVLREVAKERISWA